MNEAEKEVIAKSLAEIVRRAEPQASTVDKYGGVLFTLQPELKEGQFCGVFKYTKHVQLAIGFGPQLHDPQGLLQGTGKTRRHVNFRSADQLEGAAKALVPLLKQAAKLSLAEND